MVNKVININGNLIKVAMEDGAFHIVNDQAFRAYLKKEKLAALKLSRYLRKSYRDFLGKEFKVSSGSMVVEIYAHLYPGEFMKALTKSKYVPNIIKKFAHKIIFHTDIIDIGENDGIQRVIFDPLGGAVNLIL